MNAGGLARVEARRRVCCQLWREKNLLNVPHVATGKVSTSDRSSQAAARFHRDNLFDGFVETLTIHDRNARFVSRGTGTRNE